MTYTYRFNWLDSYNPFYDKWVDAIRKDFNPPEFHGWITNQVPEATSIRCYHNSNDIEIDFKSKEHYTWFLLKNSA